MTRSYQPKQACWTCVRGKTPWGSQAASLVRRLARGSLNMLFRKHLDERSRYGFDEPAYDGGLQSMPGEQFSSSTGPR
jgi:hypothetical protein